jgi:hypothetical protein
MALMLLLAWHRLLRAFPLFGGAHAAPSALAALALI